MDMIKLIAIVCAVVGSISVTGCVSIHNENRGAPAEEASAEIPTPVIQAVSEQTEVPPQSEPMVQMVALEQTASPDAGSGQVDILKDAKKPCSSVADDADKFKK